jgi:hypothetical protein
VLIDNDADNAVEGTKRKVGAVATAAAHQLSGTQTPCGRGV